MKSSTNPTIAIIARESDAAALAGRLRQANEVHTSPIAIYEAVLGLARVEIRR
jgi:uncharacterized protein with PIN domain